MSSLTSTVNDAYNRLSRAVINLTLEDAYDIRYVDEVQDYVYSGLLLVQSVLAKLAFDLVRNTILGITFLTKSKGVMPIRYTKNPHNHLMYYRTKCNLLRSEVEQITGISAEDIYDYEWDISKADSKTLLKLSALYNCEVSKLIK